jgi:hypothetical protein
MSELKHLPMTPAALWAEQEALLKRVLPMRPCIKEFEAAKAAETPEAFFNVIWRNAGWLFQNGLYDVREVPEGLSCKRFDLIGYTSLKKLYLEDCTNLERLDLSGHTSLKKLCLEDCTNLERLDLSGCTDLERLNLRGCISLKRLDLRGCTNLEWVDLHDCTNLEWVDFGGCTGLTRLPENLKCERLYLRGCPAPVPETARVGEVIR